MIYTDEGNEFQVQGDLINEVVMGFKVYNIVRVLSPEDRIEYVGEHGELFETTDKVMPAIRGSLKWDGCINYEYPESKEYMLHKCGERMFDLEREVWKQVYIMGKQLIGERWYK